MPRRYRHAFVALLLAIAMLGQVTWALAGTTGTLNGTVRDADSGAPIANAAVTATSPSQSASTTTDASGHYSFVSLNPDTYSVSSTKDQYDPASEPGISVFADNTQTVNISMRKALKTIARVTSRSSTDLIKPGTTSDVYSVNAATQNAVQGLGGGGALNSAYSGIASVPGVFIPQGQNGWAQSVYVRGANYTQLGYEFDGVPVQRAFDQYPATNVSALGQQELQVYTGAAPANSQSSAIGGYINQVIKTGTFPGFGGIQGGLGTPTFYHKIQFEAGGATPNRLFSYYVATAGYSQDYRYASQYNGADLDQVYGSLYNVVAANCTTANPTAGCYANSLGTFGAVPLGPNGYAFGPFYYGITDNVNDRESVVNLHFGLPHKRDAGRDDIQILYDIGYLKTQYPTSFSDWTYAQNDVLNGSATYQGTDYPNCATAAPGAACALLGGAPQFYFDKTMYTGPIGVPLTSANLAQVTPYLQPGSPTNRAFLAQTPLTERDAVQNNAGVLKIQYQKNIGTNAFFRVYGYTMYSDWLNQALAGSTLTQNFVGSVPPDYELTTHTNGVSASFVDQLTSAHLLNITAGYTHANTIRWNNRWYLAGRTVAVAVDSTNPTNGLCYTSNGAGGTAPIYCGAADVWQYRLPRVTSGSFMLAPRGTSPLLSAIGSFTCGSGPCEYFTVQNGLVGPYNTVAPAFTNFSIDDTWKPNDRITVNLGLHYDDFKYNLDDTNRGSGNQPIGNAARTLFQNSFNTFNCFSNATGLVPATSPGVCPSGTSLATWSNNSPGSTDFRAWQPRIGATFTVNPYNVLRFSYGKYEQPPSTAFEQYNAADYNLAAADSAFYGFGYHTPQHTVYPEESYNLDFSWEHQTRGSDLSWKITPYLRNTRNEIFNVLLDPKTNFISGINVGRKRVQGVELAIRKGNFNQNGFAGMLSYTYTYGRVKFDKLASGTTVVDGINQSISAYNAFTKAGGGAPCYKPATPATPTTPLIPGAPDPACAAGSLANPYYNDSPHALFSAGDEFVAYNQIPGTGASSVASSYIIPHVAALVLNYKRNKWSFTPTVQLTAGGQYGSPVQGFGVDPTSCSAALTGTTTSDPRYPFGASGGSPYNAASCVNGIVTPDLVTHQFDTFGAFREPTQITGNMQITYEASPRVTFQLLAANVYNTCFGGTKAVWNTNNKTGCWYTAGAQYTGNFYNPGDTLQPFTAFPYVPTFGNVFQQAYGTGTNPFQLFLSANIKL